MRRRRGPSTASSSTPAVTSETPVPDGSVSPEPTEPSAGAKTVDQILQEEQKSFSNFLSLSGIVTVIFIFMIRTTPLPPPGRVYAIMIDAGSTGTRAQVFRFQHDSSLNRLVLNSTDMFSMPKSISALGTGVGGTSSQFFRPILDKVKKAVPGVRRRKNTPIALRATAGLRLLGPDAADLALNKAREALNASEFLFDPAYVSVLDATYEAIYAWTSVNHLLNASPNRKPTQKNSPVAIMELGGASMQIVHVETQEAASDKPIIKSTVMDVPASGATHSVRSANLLGFGIVEYSKHLYWVFDREGVLEEGNPCFRQGKTFVDKTLIVGIGENEKTRTVTIEGDGDFDRCVASAKITIANLAGTSDIGLLPPHTVAYAYAFFYDRTVRFGLGKEPTKDEMIAKGKQLCEGPQGEDGSGEFDEGCAQFSYVYAIISLITDNFSKERGVTVRFDQYIEGHMLGWALGAVLDVVQPVAHRQLVLDHEPPTLP